MIEMDITTILNSMVTNIATISNLMVAGGTLALAYYAYKNIKSSDKQLNFLREQTKIFMTQQEPYITVQDKNIKGNKIELFLSNHGEGSAYEVAVETTFLIGEYKPTEESERLLRETPRENWDKLNIQGRFNPLFDYSLHLKNEIKDKTLFNRIRSEESKIHSDYEIVYPRCATTFIFNVENEQSLLKPGEENKCFDFEPYFLVATKKNEGLGHAQAFFFDELKDFLILNNVLFIGVIFYLVRGIKNPTAF